MQRKVSLKLYLSIVASGLLAFSGVLIETAMNVTFPTLMKQFGVNTATIQWLTTGYLLVVAIFVPISGFLKRRFTLKRLFLTANLLFIVGLLISTFADSFVVLLLGRIIQGFGTGIALPLMFNIILEQAPLEKIGFLMGIGNLVTAIAPALGPTYGGLLVDIDWHWIFGILLIVMVISLILGIFSIRQFTKTEKIKLDYLSWLLIAVFFTTAIIGLNMIESSIVNASVLALFAIASLGGFVYRSLKIKNPLINLRVFQIHSFDFHLLSFLIMQMTIVGVAFILPNYLQLVNGVSSTVAGLLLLPGATIGAILAPISGKIYDAIGPKKPILAGLSLQLLGIVLLLTQVMHASNMVVAGGYALVMLGTGFAMANVMTTGLLQVGKDLNTDGNAVYNTVQQFGGAFGTAIISLIVSLAQNPNDYATTTAIGARNGYGLLVVLILISFMSILAGLRKTKVDSESR